MPRRGFDSIVPRMRESIALRNSLLGLVFLMLAFVDTAGAKSCASMTQELARLRVDYHKYVSSRGTETGEITFEGLVGILDKIVALKDEMRRSDCKIPPRPKNVPERH